MYSKEHIKLYASVNSLITDRWNPNILYFVDKDFGTWSVIEDEEVCMPCTNVFIFPVHRWVITTDITVTYLRKVE